MEVNKIYNQNCLETMSKVSDEFLDLTVTSPPYGVIRDYHGYSFDFEPIAKELFRVTKSGGVVVWIVNDVTINGSETGESFRQALYFKEIGFNLHDTMIYMKSGCRYPETNRYYPIFEYMFVLSKGKPKTTNLIKDRKNIYAGSKLARENSIRTKDGQLIPNSAFKNEPGREIKEFGVRYNIWQFSIGKGNHSSDDIVFKHPATFPEKLANDHIISWSDEGDLVYDPFAGSGTTGIMARQNNRRFILSEISFEYCNIIKQRFLSRFTEDIEIINGVPSVKV